MPQTGSGLEGYQGIDLSSIRINQKLPETRTNRILASFQVIDDPIREPGVAAAPEDTAEIIIAFEAPAVEEQAGMLVEQILDMEQNLVFSLMPPLWPVELAPGLVQEQNRHKERINP